VRDAARRGKLKLALVAATRRRIVWTRCAAPTARGVAMIEGLTSADSQRFAAGIGIGDWSSGCGTGSGIRRRTRFSCNEDVARQKASGIKEAGFEQASR
jgi:hypothetical protein